ncbi:MAG TPA: AIR synthase-related protein, partial [Gaiellaceae bacterium]|nr:AIR synthase-related protein [Gaiellaceae bacterium]
AIAHAMAKLDGAFSVVLLATAPGDLHLAAEAALIRYVWKAAPLLSLAHDVSHGGVAAAVREAADHSGFEADVELPDEAPGGRVLLGCASDDVARLGTRNIVRLGSVRG